MSNYITKIALGLAFSLCLVACSDSQEQKQPLEEEEQVEEQVTESNAVENTEEPNEPEEVQVVATEETQDDQKPAQATPTETKPIETNQPNDDANKKPKVTEKPKEDLGEVFELVEQNATPIGGMEAFYEYVSKEVKYPEQARQNKIQGKVILSFVVEKDGKLTNAEVMKGVGAGCDEEAVRVINNAPAWKPAKHRGENVRQRMRVPITFRLEEQ
ncbi:MAG: energy transducer TonB [Bernardetiaceae bacterium]|nr:energy transducer TonB [Bernardetiaceae bacterium]